MKEVKNTFVREVNTLVHVFVGEEEIITTTNHPFYVVGEGFVQAGDLKVGSPLLLLDGTTEKVSRIYVEALQTLVKVYNFEVEDWHTYYVSEEACLVHNSCGVGGSKTANPYELEPTHPQTKSNRQMNKLTEQIKADGKIKETIKYVEYKGKKYVVDGHHRLIAAKRLHFQEVPIEEVELPYKGYNTIDDLLWCDEY